MSSYSYTGMDEVVEPFDEFLAILHDLKPSQLSRLDQGWELAVKEADFVRGWQASQELLEGVDFMKHINETIPRSHQGARYALAALFMAIVLRESLDYASVTALSQPWRCAWAASQRMTQQN